MGYGRSVSGAGIPVVAYNSTQWLGTTSTDWQYFDKTFVADADEFGIASNVVNTDVEFDDIVLVEDHLVGHWDMTMRDGLVQDLSNEGNNLTKIGQVSQVDGVFDKALKFDGASGYLTKSIANFRSVDDRGSITAWVKLDAIGATRVIFAASDEATSIHNIIFYIQTTGAVVIQQINAAAAQTRMESTTRLIANKDYHVAVVSSGTAYKLFIDGMSETIVISSGLNDGDWFADTTGADNISVGALKSTAASSYANGPFSDVKVWSKTLSDAEVLADYRKGAKMLRYRNTFEDAPVSLAATSVELNDFRIAYGSAKISEDTNGLKWLEAVSADTLLHTLSQQAYGTFQFDIYKYGTSSDAYIMFSSQGSGAITNPSTTAYLIRMTATTRIALDACTAGVNTDLTFTGTGYWVAQVRYSIRVTRSYSGVFVVYVRGGVYADWTQALTITNTTLTSCAYFNLHLGAGDKISNIVMCEGVLDVVNFPEII